MDALFSDVNGNLTLEFIAGKFAIDSCSFTHSQPPHMTGENNVGLFLPDACLSALRS